jgi:hypothetical protein
MRILFSLLLLFQSACVLGQADSIRFDSDFHPQDGIYTSYKELLTNQPKYPGYLLEVRKSVEVLLNGHGLYYYIQLSDKQPYTDSIFAYVEKGQFRIVYRNDILNVILKGSISTFFTENTVQYTSRYYETYDKLYIVDLNTGNINKLNPGTLGEIIRRDSQLYSEYMAIPYSDKKKILYSYILKYNKRNPIYIKPLD